MKKINLSKITTKGKALFLAYDQGMEHGPTDFNDNNVFNIAELGIGTNHGAKIIGEVLEDEKVLGTAHIAIGTNISNGGRIKAPVHLDGVFTKPTIYVDGKKIIENGKMLV